MKIRSFTSRNRTTRRGMSKAGPRLAVTILLIGAVVRPSVARAEAEGPQKPDDSLVQVFKSVPFDGTPAEPLTLNVYKPVNRAATGSPAVVLVHGGSWTQGDPDGMDTQGKLLAQQGWVGFSISYRLAVRGQPSWPANVDDVRAAVRWVGENARTYGADPTRIALIGESAGGQLAALVGATGYGEDPDAAADPARAPRIRAVATFSAPLALDQLVPDGDQGPASCGGNTSCRVFWTLPLVPGMLGCQPAQCPDTYAKASPVTQAALSKTTAPMFLANSTEEIVPIDQLNRMVDVLNRQGITVQAKRIEGDQHGNAYTSKVWNDMMPFLADQLGVPRPQPIAFVEERQLKDYVLFLFIGIFAVGLLALFIFAAVRHNWDEPGA